MGTKMFIAVGVLHVGLVAYQVSKSEPGNEVTPVSTYGIIWGNAQAIPLELCPST